MADLAYKTECLRDSSPTGLASKMQDWFRQKGDRIEVISANTIRDPHDEDEPFQAIIVYKDRKWA